MASQYRGVAASRWQWVVGSDTSYEDDCLRIGGGIWLLRDLAVYIPRQRGARVEIDLQATPTGYAIRSISSREPMSRGDILNLPLAALLEEAWSMGQMDRRGEDEQGIPTYVPSDVITSHAPPGGRGRPLDHARVEAAARAWRSATLDRLNVKHAVAAALTVSESQAAVYIRAARDRGLIPPRGQATPPLPPPPPHREEDPHG